MDNNFTNLGSFGLKQKLFMSISYGNKYVK